jgi:hypothetical protein
MSILFFSTAAGSGPVVPHGWLLVVCKQSLVVWGDDLEELLLVVLLKQFLLLESDWNELLLVLQLVDELILYLWSLVHILISWRNVVLDNVVEFLEVQVIGGLFSVGGALSVTIAFLSGRIFRLR